MNCPICNSDKSKLIFQGKSPISCNSLPSTIVEAIAASMQVLDMYLCEGCDHVYNAETVEVVYDSYPMFNEGWIRHIKEQAFLLNQCSKCQRVIDIGGGDGQFLDYLAKSQDSKFYILDPASRSDNHIVLSDPMDIENVNPDTVILRHTLEHFLDPVATLKSIVDSVSKGTIFFIEVPNVETTIDRGWFADFMPEHPQNFSRRSLSTALAKCGLRIKSLVVSYKRTVLTVIATKGEPTEPIAFARIFSQGFDFESVRNQVQSLIDDGAILWGAAGKSATFLNCIHPQTPYVYDGDARKVGKYVPGTGQKILGENELPEDLKKIFITAPWRAADIYRSLAYTGASFYTYSNDKVGRI